MSTKFNEERLLQVLLAPQISEKATYVADKNEQVIFIVAPDATKPEIKAIVVSGYSVDSDRQSNRWPANVGFLNKPFELTELSAAVREALNRPS